MLSEDLREKKNFFFEFLHVVFNATEKHGPVFLLLVFASLYKDGARKTKWFSAYAISRKRSKV